MSKNSSPMQRSGERSSSDYLSQQYQKALRQINKLININMGYRRQIENVKQLYENLEQQTSFLRQKTINMKKDKITLWQRLQKLQKKIAIYQRNKDFKNFAAQENFNPFVEKSRISLEIEQLQINAERKNKQQMQMSFSNKSQNIRSQHNHNQDDGQNSKFTISEEKKLILDLQGRVIMQGHSIIDLEEEINAKNKQIRELKEITEKNFNDYVLPTVKKILPAISDHLDQQKLLKVSIQPPKYPLMVRSKSELKLQAARQICKACQGLTEELRLNKQWSQILHNQNINLRKRLVIYCNSFTSDPQSYMERSNTPSNPTDKQKGIVDNLKQKLRELNKKAKKDNILHKKLLLQQSDQLNKVKTDNEEIIAKNKILQAKLSHWINSSKNGYDSQDDNDSD